MFVFFSDQYVLAQLRAIKVSQSTVWIFRTSDGFVRDCGEG